MQPSFTILVRRAEPPVPLGVFSFSLSPRPNKSLITSEGHIDNMVNAIDLVLQLPLIKGIG